MRKRLSFVIFLAVSFIALPAALAQETKKFPDLLEQRDRITTQQSQPLPATLPALDAPVNAASYIVGPSDVFAVNIWTSPPIGFSAAVTPEGTLIVPTVGEVMVAGLSLADAKKKLVGEIRKRYITGEPTVTLSIPRPILVKVSGNVRNKGMYPLIGSDRVEKAIQEANRNAVPSTVTTPEQIKLQLAVERNVRSASSRNIEVRHRDGTISRADLQKYYATRDDQWNPYLVEGDEIFVPHSESPKKSIGVYGAVLQPGRFEYAEGDSLLDAIKLAYGFKTTAIVDSVEFTRFDESQVNLLTRIVNVEAVMVGRSENFALQPGDRIVAKEKRELREDFRVNVEGEVLFPGTYPITRDHTKVSEILRLAGGVTPYAALKSALIIRKPAGPMDAAREQLFSMRGNVVREDTTYGQLEDAIRMEGENVLVDFEKLLMQKDSTQDILLCSEDRIVIPSLQKTVYVYGQVARPSHVPFVSGKSADYYVREAGGYTAFARSGDVVVIKSATRQWLAPGETSIEAGDFVWVPKERDRDPSYYLNIISQGFSILTGTLTVILLYIQVTK
ncbi:MAG: SLBB domain-containing protein [Bacteroidota bacterium]